MFRSGYIAILGRPNVGKSTLLNRILGEKISIVSEKPQTTRNRIVGIHNEENAQAVFLDTPGIHKGRDVFNKWMVEQALSTLSEVDLAVFVVEVNNLPGPGDRAVVDSLAKSRKPAILAGNKVDLVPEELRAKKIAAYSGLMPFVSAHMLSASTGEGVEALLKDVVSRLPEGPKYFPDDQLTDLPERFLAAELVREKVFVHMRQEIPYAVAVACDSFKEEETRIRIDCTLYVERESQKGMLIGKSGAMLKTIGTEARLDLEKLLATMVVLKLWVKVKPEWSRDPKKLRSMGYDVA